MNSPSSAEVISLALAWAGVSENPLHSPAISRSLNLCHTMPLRPATNGTTSMPRSASSAFRLCASRITLALKPPQNPRSLVRIRTAARAGFATGSVSGCRTLADLLTTASIALVISRAYGAASWTRCCALRILEEAMSSWARVILAVDLTVPIRRLTARSCAPIWLLLLRRRNGHGYCLLLDLAGLDGLGRIVVAG